MLATKVQQFRLRTHFREIILLTSKNPQRKTTKIKFENRRNDAENLETT